MINHAFNTTHRDDKACAICGSTDELSHTWYRYDKDGNKIVGNGRAPQEI